MIALARLLSSILFILGGTSLLQDPIKLRWLEVNHNISADTLYRRTPVYAWTPCCPGFIRAQKKKWGYDLIHQS